MKDTYTQLVNTPVGKKLAGGLGLPQPTPLRRYQPGQDLLPHPGVLLAGGAGSDQLAEALLGLGLQVNRHPEPKRRYGAIIADFTAVQNPADLQPIALKVSAALRGLAGSGLVTPRLHAAA